ncbi:MAG: S41 family peptidase, partial [Cyanobacteria bacterium J06641_5]
NRQTSGELSGVGIRLAQEEDSKQLLVVEPIDNSPAAAAGVASGDAILAIDGQPTLELSIESASELIRGRSGTDVTLRLSRAGRGEFDVVLTRAKIELPAVNYELRTENSGQRIGYIQLDEFSGHATEQMRAAIAELREREANAFVLDLRGNPGGLLFASIEIARLWYDSGEIVRTQDRQGGDRSFAANQTAITDLPLAVLVDGRSASASEILAGALQDNDRAVIVGTRTFGKGTVQSVQALSDGSGLAVTISQYFPPSGVAINKRGIAPDIEVTLDRETRRRWRNEPDLRGTSAGDPQYARALNALLTQAQEITPRAENLQPNADPARDRAAVELPKAAGTQ